MTQETEKLHYEDVVAGRTVTFGRKVVTKEEIVAFARTFDPQPFHLDEEAAKTSMVGRLCASGWHSCTMLMRMLADDVLGHAAALGSPGVEQAKWMKPVVPGDVLSARYTCLDKRPLRSRPGVGICRLSIEMLNRNGETVMSWETSQFLRLRRPDAQS
ncbi:MAG: MaoC family dehydratase [Hyphomicrobiaceae bacterium]